MKITRFVNIPLPAARAATAAAPAPTAPTVSSFITTQSLTSFPIASFAVTLLTAAIRKLGGPGAQNSTLIPFFVSLLVGGIIFMISISDKDNTSRPTTASEWTIAIFVGVMNSVVLFMAAIGALQTVADNASTPAAHP